MEAGAYKTKRAAKKMHAKAKHGAHHMHAKAKHHNMHASAKRHMHNMHAKAHHDTRAMGAGAMSSPSTDMDASSRQARIDQAYANWKAKSGT
jgi:hypothetical protein